MEEFLKIDWKTDINDIIDNVFISEERLLKESAMYRILSGTFKDPFGIISYPEMSKKLIKPKAQSKKQKKKKKKSNAAKKKKEIEHEELDDDNVPS